MHWEWVNLGSIYEVLNFCSERAISLLSLVTIPDLQDRQASAIHVAGASAFQEWCLVIGAILDSGYLF